MVSSPSTVVAPILASTLSFIGVASLSILFGCGPRDATDPLPEGELFVGRSDGIAAWIEPLATMQESRLVAGVGRLANVVGECAEVEGTCAVDSDCELLEEIRCRASSADLASAWELLGEGDWIVSRRLDGRRWTAAGRRLPNGEMELEVDLPQTEGRSLSNLLMPSADGPGATHLGGEGLLVHLRFRPAEGLDIGSLVSGEEMGAGLFQLKSDLFLAAVLKGNWELAVHTPGEGDRFPPMSMALDFRARGPAVSAMEQLLENLTAVWPVRRDPYELSGWAGECLGNLNVLPDLAPCFVATDGALVIGWNASSLELALSAAPEALDPESSGGVFHLSRFAAADERLARAYASEDDRVLVYPWSRAVVTGNQVGNRFVFRLALSPGGTP